MSAQNTLRELLAECAFDADDAETPSEEIVYRPNGGDARTIRAIVTREIPREIGNARSPLVRLTVQNDATDGITAAEIDDGADQIDVATKPGGTATTRNIYRVVSSNTAFVTLEVK